MVNLVGSPTQDLVIQPVVFTPWPLALLPHSILLTLE